MGWQPIETAPKDGTRVLCFVPGKYVPARKGRIRKTNDRYISAVWVENPPAGKGQALSDHAIALCNKHGGFWTATGRKPIAGCPSHWMFLPLPPEEGDADASRAKAG